MSLTLDPQFWWYLTRAAGVTAWVAGSGSLLLGLALATRTLGNRPKGPWLLDLHRGLAGVTMAFLALHLAALVADSYTHFGVADVLVPFASGWKPAAVAGGVISAWLLVAVEVTSLAKKRLPARWWRAVHLSSYGAAIAATVHAFTAGTDAGNPGFVAVAVVTVVGAAFMTTYRFAAPRRSARRIPARPAAVAQNLASVGSPEST